MTEKIYVYADGTKDYVGRDRMYSKEELQQAILNGKVEEKINRNKMGRR